MAVLVLHRGGFRDGLIYECDAEVGPGSMLTYQLSSLARLPRAEDRVAVETVELSNGEIAAVALLQTEEPN